MKILEYKNYSLTIKNLILFFLLTILLITIRTILAQPKIKEKNTNDEINFISKTLLVERDLLNNLSAEIKNNINFEENIKESIKISLVNNLGFKSANIKLFYSKSLDNNLIISEENNLNETILIWQLCLLSFSDDKKLFLKYFVDKKEIEEKNSVRILMLFLLPETLIAIGISIILLLIIFTKMLNNMDSLTKNLTKSLEEKELLLKEIHHRVKNNLALTISLIELQEEEVFDFQSQKILTDIKERIYTMELLHRKLYESDNLNKIPFKIYVTDLINMISSSYDKEKVVDINTQIEELQLSIESAMPYGLILNELITNAFKYAFKEHLNPKLDIKVFKKDEEIILILKDNGKGFTKEFSEICNNTLGLKLVNTIVKLQLEGIIICKYDEGTEFIIKAKI